VAQIAHQVLPRRQTRDCRCRGAAKIFVAFRPTGRRHRAQPRRSRCRATGASRHKGADVLIYDQTLPPKSAAAAGGLYPDPRARFHQRSGLRRLRRLLGEIELLSVMPAETEFGRNGQIDQSNCNKDFSCLKASAQALSPCARGAAQARCCCNERSYISGLPEPAIQPLDAPTASSSLASVARRYHARAILGMAAHLEAAVARCSTSASAQKNGAVMSHVRLAPQPDDLHAVRIAAGGADLLLACDPVVAASPRRCHGSTANDAGVLNSNVKPTAAFIFNQEIDFEAARMLQAIKAAACDADLVDATGLAAALMGDSIAANLFMLGYAFQKGLCR